LKNLEQEFEDSSNGIRLELNKFEEAGLLTSSSKGNKKIFQANTSHPLFKDIHSIILKYTGIDQILESVIERLGNVNSVYLVGSLAKGLDAKVIDIILVGDINKEYLLTLIEKAEPMIGKKIKYILYQPIEFMTHEQEILSEEHLLIWSK
jgi:predicted nucleotidyltransferase